MENQRMNKTYAIEIENLPEGFVPVRYGIPRKGDWWIVSTGDVEQTDGDWISTRVLILKKTGRPVTIDDLDKPVNLRICDPGRREEIGRWTLAAYGNEHCLIKDKENYYKTVSKGELFV